MASKLQEARDWVDTHDDEAPKPRLIAAALAGDVMPVEPIEWNSRLPQPGDTLTIANHYVQIINHDRKWWQFWKPKMVNSDQLYKFEDC